MRDDFKNKFSNNRRVFSFNHLCIRFFARYFYLQGGGGVEELENYQEIFAEKEGELQPFWQTVDPARLLLIFIYFLRTRFAGFQLKTLQPPP